MNSANTCRQELDGAPLGEAPSSGHSRVLTLDPDSRPFLFLNTPSNLLQNINQVVDGARGETWMKAACET